MACVSFLFDPTGQRSCSSMTLTAFATIESGDIFDNSFAAKATTWHNLANSWDSLLLPHLVCPTGDLTLTARHPRRVVEQNLPATGVHGPKLLLARGLFFFCEEDLQLSDPHDVGSTPTSSRLPNWAPSSECTNTCTTSTCTCATGCDLLKPFLLKPFCSGEVPLR